MVPVASFSGTVEFGSAFSPRPQISHVIFDFDGTLSWLRHGWPRIMSSLFREHLPVRLEEAEAAIQEMLLTEILSLNGKASIHQMSRCAELVRDRGGTPPDPEKLLQEYQRRLDQAIAERTGLIRRSEAKPDDFVVHGARALLEKLKERGLTLIILSGTVEHRVKEEAALLGLTQYFGNHIYGGTADLAQSSKNAVIERLLQQERLTGENLLSFGDGPVEIQLTKKSGGLAVGIASDEDVNGSGKLDSHKRSQLVFAGADLLIPDYRDHKALVECLLSK